MTLPSNIAEREVCGIRSLVLLVIASMVGAGVFTTSGFTLAAVGSPGRVMVCWLVGAGIAICGAIAYGRLVRLIPESGGEYLYLSRFVHPLAGFLAGWISLTAGFSGALAVAAVTFEQYALSDLYRPHWLPPDVMAILVIAVCGCFHATRFHTGIRFQNSVVVVQILAVIAFLSVVGWKMPNHDWHTESLAGFKVGGSHLARAMAVSVVWISLSYAGFNAAIYVASESQEAARNVPAALLWGTGIVSVLYLLLNAAFVGSVPGNDLAGQADVAAIAGRALGGPSLETVVRVAVVMGLLSSVSGMILTGPRVYQKMAEDGVFPQWFKGPAGIRSSVGLQCLLAAGIILIHRIVVKIGWAESSLSQMLTFLGSTLSLSSAACVATLFLPAVRLRTRQASRFSLVAAGIYVAASLTAIVLMTTSSEEHWFANVVRHLTGTTTVFASGIAAWFVFRRSRAIA